MNTLYGVIRAIIPDQLAPTNAKGLILPFEDNTFQIGLPNIPALAGLSNSLTTPPNNQTIPDYSPSRGMKLKSTLSLNGRHFGVATEADIETTFAANCALIYPVETDRTLDEKFSIHGKAIDLYLLLSLQPIWVQSKNSDFGLIPQGLEKSSKSWRVTQNFSNTRPSWLNVIMWKLLDESQLNLTSQLSSSP